LPQLVDELVQVVLTEVPPMPQVTELDEEEEVDAL